MSYKPEGYTSVAPYLIVEDGDGALGFLKAAFGSEPLRVFRREDGTLMHAEVRLEDTVIMLGQMSPGLPCHVHVYVPDVDAAFARAVRAGGTVFQQVTEKGDGDRRGGVTDPHGITWWFSTQLPIDS